MIITTFKINQSKVDILQLIMRSLILFPFYFIFSYFFLFLFFPLLSPSLSLSLSFSARFFLDLIQTWALLRNAERALALINRITGAVPAGVYSLPPTCYGWFCSWYIWYFPLPYLFSCSVALLALCCDLEDTREWDASVNDHLFLFKGFCSFSPLIFVSSTTSSLPLAEKYPL